MKLQLLLRIKWKMKKFIKHKTSFYFCLRLSLTIMEMGNGQGKHNPQGHNEDEDRECIPLYIYI